MSGIEQKDKYPVALVIFTYGILGGFVGSGIVTLYFFVTIFFEGGLISLIAVPFVVVMVAILGFIPAVFAGIWFAIIKFIVTKKSDYFKVAVIGYLSTVFYLGTYPIIKRVVKNIPIDNIFELLNLNLDSSTLYIGLVGGLSAMIVGWIVLPKKLHSTKK